MSDYVGRGGSTRPQTESVQDDARWSEAEGREAAELSLCLFYEVGLMKLCKKYYFETVKLIK